LKLNWNLSGVGNIIFDAVMNIQVEAGCILLFLAVAKTDRLGPQFRFIKTGLLKCQRKSV